MTASRSSILAVFGIEKTTSMFRRLLVELADRLAMDVDHLATVISFESAGTFSPSKLNMAGSGAVGLIQFMPNTAIGLGTTTAALAAMTAEEQLVYVEKFFKPRAGKLHTLDDVYLAVFYPAAIGKPPSYVVFDKEGTVNCPKLDPTTCYRQNKGFDKTGKGYITVADITATVHEVQDAAQGRRIDVETADPQPLPTGSPPRGGLAFLVSVIAGWFGYRWLKSSRK